MSIVYDCLSTLLSFVLWCPPQRAQSQTQYDEVLASATISLRHVKVRSLWDCLQPPAAAATHLPSVGDAHYLCSPHHCSDGLCRDNNSPFNLLNNYNCKKTTAFVASVNVWIFDIWLDVHFRLVTSGSSLLYCLHHRWVLIQAWTMFIGAPMVKIPTCLMNLYSRAMRPPVFFHCVYSEAANGGKRGDPFVPR